MTPLQDLLLAALHRSPKPLSAADALDQAIGLGMAEGWPETVWLAKDARAAAALLRSLCDAGLAVKSGESKDGRAGRMAPVYEPAGGRQPSRPIGKAPEKARRHTLDGLSRVQMHAIFDGLNDALEVYATKHQELSRFMLVQQQHIASVAARVKRQLVAAGVPLGEDDE